jgi:hypothetical protein
MVYSYVGYCRCGCEVWIEYLLDGNGWFHRLLMRPKRFIDFSAAQERGNALNFGK